MRRLLLFAVHLRVFAPRLVTVMHRLRGVAASCVAVVRRLFVTAARVMFGGLAMVLGGAFVMLRGFHVMLPALLRGLRGYRHWLSFHCLNSCDFPAHSVWIGPFREAGEPVAARPKFRDGPARQPRSR